jgi:hypothetical protein
VTEKLQVAAFQAWEIIGAFFLKHEIQFENKKVISIINNVFIQLYSAFHQTCSTRFF